MSIKNYGNKRVYPTAPSDTSGGLNFTEYLIGQVIPAVITKADHYSAEIIAVDTLAIVDAMI